MDVKLGKRRMIKRWSQQEQSDQLSSGPDSIFIVGGSCVFLGFHVKKGCISLKDEGSMY